MDSEMLADLAALATQRGVPRAQIIRDACYMLLRELEEAEQDRAYVEAYRRVPEGPEVGQGQLRMAARLLASELDHAPR